MSSELFTHWTFESFAPGSIPRVKYNAFQSIHDITARCFSLMAMIQDVEFGQRQVDWSRIVSCTAELSACIRLLIDQLQIMNPVQFMDVHDWANKIGFYARLATSFESVSATPPYIQSLDLLHAHHDLPLGAVAACTSLPAIIIEPSLFQYFVERNDLRPDLDTVLHSLDLGHKEHSRAHSRALQKIIQRGTLPARLSTELDIAAVDLAPGGGSVDVWALIGQGQDAFLAGTYAELKAGDFAATWIQAASFKYAPQALASRLCRGLADEEDPLTLVLTPAGAAHWAGKKSCSSEHTAALLRRLETVTPYVTRVQVGERSTGRVRAEQCKSLHDLVCLCLDHSLAQVFSFAGEPARGLGSIKELRLEIPASITIFNLGDGLFPSAVEKTTITVEDMRCVPMWSMLLGLTCPVVDWETINAQAEGSQTAQRHNYAVIAQNYMYCILRLGLQLHILECRSDDGCTGFVRYQFKGSEGNPWERAQQQRVVRLILEDQGFMVTSCGDYLEAVRSKEKEVTLQRSLAGLGLLAAWLQSCTPESFTSLNPVQGRELFQDYFARFLSHSR